MGIDEFGWWLGALIAAVLLVVLAPSIDWQKMRRARWNRGEAADLESARRPRGARPGIDWSHCRLGGVDLTLSGTGINLNTIHSHSA